MATYKIEDTTLIGIADEIRAKIGGTSTIRVDKMAAAIKSLGDTNSNLSFRTDNGIVELNNVESLFINNAEVTQLLLNGIAIWGDGLISITNLILTATTEPGGAEIFNGTGYVDGARWSSSGGAVKYDNANARISGWMPYTPNAVCRIQGFNASQNGYVANFYMVGCKADGSIVTKTFKVGTTAEYDATNDIATFTTPNEAYKYFRISAYVGSINPVVTINEEII